MAEIEHGQESQEEALAHLRAYTTARIGIGRTGVSIPTKQSLAFKLAHAHARDAVYSALDIDKLTEGLIQFGLPVLHLHSEAAYREQYLQRPDLGRRLNKESIDILNSYTLSGAEVVIVIADGLSATAVNTNTISLLKILIPQIQSAGLRFAPLCLVKQGRVAIADDIGMLLRARLSLMLIGERPGLSSANSMGAYITYNPQRGLTDESRNCISNIRVNGLNYKQASRKIFYLIQEAITLKLSGVGLKDNTGRLSG